MTKSLCANGFCQSCGMPLKKDPQGGGSEADGTRSVLYCSLCYADGRFTSDITDVREFQRMVMAKMIENGWKKPLAWLFTRNIRRLGRWRKP